jgi:hypothetical protein
VREHDTDMMLQTAEHMGQKLSEKGLRWTSLKNLGDKDYCEYQRSTLFLIFKDLCIFANLSAFRDSRI